MSGNTRLAVAVHVCLLLARAEERLSSDAIAESVDTNPVVIRRCVCALQRAGIVETQMGKGGGSMLAKKARDITMLDIHRAVDDGRGFFGMPEKQNRRCPVSCGVKDVLGIAFGRAEEAVEKTLGKIKLSDLAEEIARGL